MKKLFQLSLFIAISILLFSCGKGDLSRGKAEDLITEKYNLPLIDSLVLKKYYYKSSKHVQYRNDDHTVLRYARQNTYYDNENLLLELKKKEVITIGDTVIQEREDNADDTYAIILLTDEGRKYLIKEYSGKYVVKTGEIDFDEVTGIQKMEQLKIAEVHYKLKKTKITPFAESATETTIERTQSFSLYDDGWRISE